MSDYSTISADLSAPVARVVLNRPGAANTMNLTMTQELADVATRCAYSGNKVVVITGTGRFFCAGGDLGDFAGAASPGAHIKGVADSLHRAISTFARMDAVLIAAVNGVAAGAGLSLAACSNLVVATESASFTMAYTQVGLSPDGSASYFLPRLIGLRRTQELMLTNRTLSAEDAQQWGLVTQVVDDTRLGESVAEMAGRFVNGPGAANSAVKRLLLSTFDSGLEQQMELEGQLIARNADSADGREGVAAFLRKRRPDFTASLQSTDQRR